MREHAGIIFGHDAQDRTAGRTLNEADRECVVVDFGHNALKTIRVAIPAFGQRHNYNP
jgi:hypothetical protein